MKITVDKVLIDAMNKEYSLHLTYADFKKFYVDIVKPLRLPGQLIKEQKALQDEIINQKILDSIKK